ncbi:TPA: hypothetical protein ACYUN4_001808 [Escherichia coli]|nr:hypothetical protein [Escherichia coli]
MTTNNHPANGPVSLDRLHQIREILSKAAAQSDGGNLGYAMADAVKVINWAIAAFGSEPVRYLNKFSGTCVTLEQQSNAADDVAVYMPLYAAPPVQETGVYNDVLNIIGLLGNNEWAEHCANTVLGSLLESEITRLVGATNPAPDNKQTDELVMWVKRLAHSLRKSNPDCKLQNDAMDYLSRKGLISVETYLR